MVMQNSSQSCTEMFTKIFIRSIRHSLLYIYIVLKLWHTGGGCGECGTHLRDNGGGDPGELSWKYVDKEIRLLIYLTIKDVTFQKE
jgi:hypothetical protein